MSGHAAVQAVAAGCQAGKGGSTARAAAERGGLLRQARAEVVLEGLLDGYVGESVEQREKEKEKRAGSSESAVASYDDTRAPNRKMAVGIRGWDTTGAGFSACRCHWQQRDSLALVQAAASYMCRYCGVGAGARTRALLQFDVGVGGAMMSRWRMEEGKSSSLGWVFRVAQKVGVVGHRHRRRRGGTWRTPIQQAAPRLHAAR